MGSPLLDFFFLEQVQPMRTSPVSRPQQLQSQQGKVVHIQINLIIY